MEPNSARDRGSASGLPETLIMSFKTSFLRFLTGQKPLARLLPNYRELLADPARVLDRAPVKIRPLRLVRLALFLFVATPLLPFALNLDNLLGKVHWVVDVLVFGIWPLLALLMLLLPVRDRLILGRNDVTFQHGRLCVICPWQLFNVAGNAQGHDPEQFLVAVPVDPNEAHRVVLIQNDVVLARGAGVHTPEFRFHWAREVHLSGRYQASPTEVGSLLLTLGRRLGAGDARHEPALVSQLVESIGLLHDLPDGTPMPMRLDDRGWVALPLLNLSLAPLCCVCGVPTERCLDVEVGRGDFVGRLLHVTLGETSVKVPVPLSAACLARRRSRLWIGPLLGVLPGLLLLAA